MAANEKFHDARTLTLAPSNPTSLIKSGDPVRVGKLVGVALEDQISTDPVVVDLGGGYELTAKAINDAGNSAIIVGDDLFFVDADTPKLSKKSSGYFAGTALTGLGSGATGPVTVKLSAAGSSTGTLDLADGSVTNAKLAAGPEGSLKVSTGDPPAPADLDIHAAGTFPLGDGDDVIAATMTGDVTMTGAGVTAIGATKVRTAMIHDAEVTAPKLGPGVIVASGGLYGNDLGAPDLAVADHFLADVAMKATAYTLDATTLPAGNPPRNVTVTLATVTAAPADNDTVGSIVLDGTDVDDVVIHETVVLTPNAAVASTKAFKTLTGARTAGWIIDAGAGIADRITIGFGDLLGLAQVHAAASEVFAALFDGVFVAPDGVTVDPADVALNTVDLSSHTYDGAKTAKAVLMAA